MAVKTLKPYLRIFSLSALLLVSACGNPFSRGSDGPQIPKNEFHTKTESCNQINLSSETLDENQVRKIVACLNSNHEIEAIDQLIQSLSSAEIKPLITLVNSTTEKNPLVFYSVKEMYVRIKNDGRLGQLEALAQLLLRDPQANQKFADTIKPLAKVVRELILNQSVTLSLKNIDQVTSSAAYRRFIEENEKPEVLAPFADSVIRYLRSSDAVPLEKLYQMLSTSSVADAFKTLTSDGQKKKLEKLASFLEYTFTDNRFETLASALENIKTKKIICFGGKVEIKAPLASALSELSKKNSAEARVYFTHDLKNLLLTSRGYCDLPYSLDPLINFLDEASRHPAFDEIYTLIRPLMNDESFVNFLASSATREFVKSNAVLAKQHFFQDLLVLVLHVQEAPLSDNGVVIARVLDQALAALDARQVHELIRFFDPILSREADFGNQTVQLLRSLVDEFPKIKTVKQSGLREELASFAATLIQHPTLGSVLTLTSELIESKKLTGILDETLMIFDRFLNRAKTKLNYGIIATRSWVNNSLNSLLLNKIKAELISAKAEPIECKNLNLDWNFSEFNSSNPKAYLQQLDLIELCVDPNPGYRAIKSFALDLIAKGHYGYLLKTQKSVVNHAFQISQSLPFESFKAFLALDSVQKKSLESFLKRSSQLVAITTEPLLKKPELRRFLSTQSLQPGLYSTLSDYLNVPEAKVETAPALDVMALNQIDLQLSKEEFTPKEDFTRGIDRLFTLYCPTGNSDDASCDIDEDQVKLFRSSKSALITAIKNEFMASSQSWLHPKQFQGWKHTSETPVTVSDFEYHLNPMLHLLRNSPKGVDAIFSAVERIGKHHYDLELFLKERATRITLIPYVFQVPSYPQSGKREFHDRMRLRILSDIDRLELIAINADFKAFGLVQNMGMNFIREIGLSWGDVAENERPASLANHKSPEQVRTLKETRDYVFSEMSRFDRGIIQRLGECDPRGKGRFGRWIQRRLCSNEIFDISARLFNLRFLIPLLDREIADTESKSGGLALLRDLFYSFTEANDDRQLGFLGDGVAVGADCLERPSLNSEPVVRCNRDLLTYIPRITRLGLLHQLGMSFLKDQNTPASPAIELLKQLSSQKKITRPLSTFLSSESGIKTFESGVHFGFQTKAKIGTTLSELVSMSATVKNQNWVSAATQFVSTYPDFLDDHSILLETLLSGDGSSARAFSIAVGQNAKNATWINQLSNDLTPALMVELAQSLRAMKATSPTLAHALGELMQVAPLNSAHLTRNLSQWLTLLADEKSRSSRQALSTFITSEEFEQFCAVYSDSSIIDRTYNFLDQIHQNSDSSLFFQSCEAFFLKR